MLPFLLACAGAPQQPVDVADNARLLAEAVELAIGAPTEAAERCLQLVGTPELEACVEEVAPKLGRVDRDGALSLCERLNEVDECIFRVAETSLSGELCERAGRFEFDCRMHIFSITLRDWLPEGLQPGEVEALASERVAAAGFEERDGRPWSAIWRWTLGAVHPLDRGACAEVSGAHPRKACELTAVALFHDRLNHHRDLGAELCEGPLPSEIEFVPDEALTSALERRRAGDLCDEGARNHPPEGELPGEGR